MIDKILATIDSSERSQSIFNTAVSLAQSTGASLMFLHILSEEDPDYPMLPTYAYYSILKGEDDSTYREQFDQYEEQEAELLRSLTKKAIVAGVEAEYTQLSGVPGWEICELARAWSADLILVGSRGLKGLKEMFLGSVSNYVTHHAPCSVLIVRNDIDLVSYPTDLPFEQEAKADREQEVSNRN